MHDFENIESQLQPCNRGKHKNLLPLLALLWCSSARLQRSQILDEGFSESKFKEHRPIFERIHDDRPWEQSTKHCCYNPKVQKPKEGCGERTEPEVAPSPFGRSISQPRQNDNHAPAIDVHWEPPRIQRCILNCCKGSWCYRHSKAWSSNNLCNSIGIEPQLPSDAWTVLQSKGCPWKKYFFPWIQTQNPWQRFCRAWGIWSIPTSRGAQMHSMVLSKSERLASIPCEVCSGEAANRWQHLKNQGNIALRYGSVRWPW